MALKNYNNNEKSINNVTFSSIVFSNSESNIAHSRFSVGYFNKVMRVGIALQNNKNSNNSYATYDTENQINVYVSYSKAYVLSKMIDKLKQDDSIHNVCIELKNGLLKISDGSEYGVNTPCFSISYANESGEVTEVIYQTKNNLSGAYNYNEDGYKTIDFPDVELDTFQMVLDEYYRASSYAIAATVMEASMYKRNYITDIIKGIADKVGYNHNSGFKSYNSKTFLNNNSNTTSIKPKEYESSSFEELVNNM